MALKDFDVFRGDPEATRDLVSALVKRTCHADRLPKSALEYILECDEGRKFKGPKRKAWLALDKCLRDLFTVDQNSFVYWQLFYRECFHTDLDKRDIIIPKRKATDPGTLIVVAPIILSSITLMLYENLTMSKGVLESGADSWEYWNQFEHDRDPHRDGAYAVWANGGGDPDTDLKSMTCREIRAQGIPVMTIYEYLILKLFRIWVRGFDGMDGGQYAPWHTVCMGSVKKDSGDPAALTSTDDVWDFTVHGADDKEIEYFDCGVGCPRRVLYADPLSKNATGVSASG